MSRAPELGPGVEGLNRLEAELILGLEKVIDHTLERHRRGEPFAYGIHQRLSPRMVEVLRRRYREAGWAEVILREGHTGAFMLVLHP